MKNYKNQVFINEINKKMIEWLYRVINLSNMEIRRIKPYTTIFERIQNNLFFHTQYIVDKLIKQMNDTHIIDWNINTSIAVYFSSKLLKEDFPLKRKSNLFLINISFLILRIYTYGENTIIKILLQDYSYKIK